MTSSKPGKLSIRALNQYRNRDVFAYLGLRYYLYNTAARSDQWARQVATNLVTTRDFPSYHKVFHYKDFAGGQVVNREIFIPGPNEALAEAALLYECTKFPVFSNLPCVFSYELADGDDTAGIFKHYMKGLRARNRAVSKACNDSVGGIVFQVDLKKFYPSIQKELAFGCWKSAAEASQLSTKYRELGMKLIHDHISVKHSNANSVLTGPMFSHLIGNLALRNIDVTLADALPAKYFRYVDDVTLVGTKEEVAASFAIMKDVYESFGFQFHDEGSPKTLRGSTDEWSKHHHNFQDDERPASWRSLTYSLKLFLLLYPHQRTSLLKSLHAEQFRLPTKNYDAVARERPFIERVKHLAKRKWYRYKSNRISAEAILFQASFLRKAYEQGLLTLLDQARTASGFHRKTIISGLRYRAGRLIYLATHERLRYLATALSDVPELFLHSQIMRAVGTGEVDHLLPLGTDAAQAAAQSIKASGLKITTKKSDLNEVEEQSLSIFLLNGISPSTTESAETSSLLNFARKGATIEMMKNSEPFIQEVACLHGITVRPRHPEEIDTAFDEDENLVMDAIDQLQQSAS